MASDPGKGSRGPTLEDLPFHLARTALVFRRFNDRTLRAVGLKQQPPGMASVLHALSERAECTVSQLVERTHLPNSTLTGLLDAMQADGSLERVDNPGDGRSWCIRLTKKGRKLCEKLQRRHRLTMDIYRDVLSDAEAARLKQLLSRVNARMHAYRGGSPKP